MGNNNTALLKSIQDEIRAVQNEMRAGFGTTYVPLEEVWEASLTSFKGAAEEFRQLRAKDTDVLDIYNKADGRNLPENAPKLERYQPPFASKSMFPGKFGRTSLAHIVPDDPICSLTWGEAVVLFSGKQEGTNMFDSKELRDFVRGNAEGASNPFKVWAWNYLQLPIDHAEYFDNFTKEKAVIITPIWDPKEVWKPGTGYKLLVTATLEGYKWLMGNKPLKKNAAQHRWLGSASENEYQIATDFLLLAVKALADLLNESPVIDLVQAAYDDTRVDSVPQGGGEEKAGSSNNGGQTPRTLKKKGQSERVKEALEKKHGLLSNIISGAFFDDSESKGTRGTNQSASV
jgi:hypothetical protein